MATAFATKVASSDWHTIKEGIEEPTFTAELLEEAESATFIAIMAEFAGVEPKFIATLVETILQNHSSPECFQLQQEVSTFKAAGITYSIMVELAADSIATMDGPNNIAVMEEEHNITAVMEQTTRAKVPKQEEEILALVAKFIDLAFHRSQSRKENYLHSFDLEKSLQA